MKLLAALAASAVVFSFSAEAGSIYMAEGNCQSWHAKQMAEHMTGLDAFCMDDGALPTTREIKELNVDLISLSAGWDWDRGYYDEDGEWDDFIYRTRIPAIAAAGNDGPRSYVVSPCRAANVICVGSYRPESSARDAALGISKPDLSYKDESTSDATASTSVLVARLIKKYEKYRNQPALIRAFLLAMASPTSDFDRDGAGVVDVAGIEGRGVGIYGDGSNASWTDQDLHVDVDRPGDYTAAISWLQRGTYLRTASRIGNSYSLTVIDSIGREVAKSSSKSNPYQIVHFSVVTPGIYRFLINRTYNDDHRCDVSLGLRVQRNS